MSTEHRNMLFSNRMSFLSAGFAIAAWAPMIPFVKERFNLDEHTLGLLLLCVGIGSFVSMPISSILSSRLGCKKPIIMASLLVALCLFAIPFIYNLYLMAAVLFIMGIGAIALDVISNINAALAEQISKRNVMSGLHGLYSVGCFVGSISVTSLLSLHFPLTLAGTYAALLLGLNAIFGLKHLLPTVHMPKEEGEDSNAQADAAPQKESTLRYYKHPLVLLVGVMCFIMFMTEGSMLDWSGVFLNTERGMSLEHAGYGYAAFAIMMTIFRLTGDVIVTKFGRGHVIILGTISIIAGFCLAVLIPHYSSAFVGFALIGVGASNVVPQLVSITARIKEVPTHISVTIVNAIGFSGVLIGPALIGFLAHAITLPYTYLCQAAGVACVTAMSLYLFKHLKHNPQQEH